jgi:hypothetical protein
MRRGARPAAAVLAALLTASCRTPAPVSAPAGARDEGTRRMAERLARLADAIGPENLFANGARAEALRRRIAVEGPVPALRLELARQLLNAGRTKEAIAELRSLVDGSDGRRRNEYRRWLAIADLRDGEQSNCLMHHNADSCLLPIQGAGRHMLREGAQRAKELYLQILAEEPTDLDSRWLLNIAAMALGEYPQELPERWRIPPQAFASAASLPRFPDVAGAAGVAAVGHAGGAVIEDFDGDGLLDIMKSSSGLRDQLRLFRNNGDGTFTDRTKEAGLEGITGGQNLIQADYDNDGHPDVLVLRGAWQYQGGPQPISLLHNNGDGTFTDVTEKAGLLGEYRTQAAAWGDYDGDGKLDLFIGDESFGGQRRPARLFHNNGDGTFTDVTARAGISVTGMIKGVVWADFDNKGLPDLFITRWGEGNVLLHNNGDGTFTDRTFAAGVSEPRESFACLVFDYDNDGWIDILAFGFFHNPSGEDGASEAAFGSDALESVAGEYLGLAPRAGVPRLYHNERDGTFRDVTRAAGLETALFAMGVNFADVDNDGYPDFYVGTGVPDMRGLMPNRLFLNDGGRRFRDATTSADVGHLQKGHGIAFGDLGNNGYPDIYAVLGGQYEGDVYQSALFANPGGRNHWLGLSLEGVRANRSAIGARIAVTALTPRGPRVVRAVVGSGGSYGANSLRLTVGLGDATEIESVEVIWPIGRGRRQVFTGLAMDRYYRLTEDRPLPDALVLPRFSWPAASER